MRWKRHLLAGLLLSAALRPVFPQAAAEAPTLPAAQALMRAQKFAEAEKMLEVLSQQLPGNGIVWYLLGTAIHSQGEFQRALPIHLKAAGFPNVAASAQYNAACSYARLGEPDKAFELLEQVKASGRLDMNQVATDADLESLRSDPRLRQLLPRPEDFEAPFVEEVSILQEWVGEAAGDQFGWIARNIGDVDGDGVPDVTTSAPTHGTPGPGAGKVYVYSSRSGKLLWSQRGESGAQLGLGIEAAGDTDADGVPDVIAGAPGTGKAYVYSGRDGRQIHVFEAENKADTFGRKVADLGDVNGDGHDDIMVGAPTNDAAGEDAGRIYVYSGKDGSILATQDGEQAGDNFGSSGGGATRNGSSLLVVGAPNAGPEHRGRTYVSRFREGRLEPFFQIDPTGTGTNLGAMFVSVVGDVDGDGTPDVYASDWHDAALGPNTGRIYVHSGRDGRRLHTIGGEQPGDGFGIGVADAGDIDGDGHDDLVVGAWQHSSGAGSGGRVYFYSGKTGSRIREITCRIPGDTFGFDTTGMGDVNGDGKIDFLITSAWSNIQGFRSGRMFILSGR